VTTSPLAPPFPMTALLSAAARAAHLVVDDSPHLLADTLAGRLLGPDGDAPIGYHRADPSHPVLLAARVEATVRGRFAEDLLAASGVRQYVIVGAGLDTYAYRNPDAGRRVLEVDLPAVQERKREALARAALPGPVTFVPADLAVTPLDEALRAAGADTDEPIFVAALGLTMYLTRGQVAGLLESVAGWPGGAHLVADHLLPPDDDERRGYDEAVGAAVAAGGEAWRTRLAPQEAADVARAAGFTAARTTNQRDALPADLWRRTDGLRPGGVSGLLHATTSGVATGR
jgi:methyltransferase (TIGR00027 family)